MNKTKNRFFMSISIITILAAIIALAAFSGGAVADTSNTTTPSSTLTATATPSAGTFTINTMTDSTLGTYLVDSNGMTLYYFTRDTANTSSANASVIANWPVFYTSSISVPDSMNTTDFGSITRSDGTMQTTFMGWPLYRYIKDTAAGDIKGEGVNDVWFVVDPNAFMPPVNYPLVNGWYRDQPIQYYDFGMNSPMANGNVVTAPIYVLITGIDSQGNPVMVAGQHNIIDVIQGDTGYSDLWQVYLVTVPSDYQADTIRSAAEVVSSGYPVQTTNNLVNCPVVPPGSITETGKSLTQGWYKDRKIYYFDFGANTDTIAPIDALITGMDAQGNPLFVSGQNNIVDTVPGNADYTAFWLVNLVTVPSGYTANTLRSFSAVAASGYPSQTTAILVNCPVVNGGTATLTPSATATPAATMTPSATPSPTPTVTSAPSAQAINVSLTAQNLAFDKSSITVTAGASVTINFTNEDNVPHNFALYTDSSAQTSIFVGQIIGGGQSTTYTFTAPATPGTYFFRCDVHPTIMTGSFIVQ